MEGFWWQDDVEGVDYKNKSAFNWIFVIRLLLFTPLPVTIDFCIKICFAKQKSTPESHSPHVNQQVIGVGLKSNIRFLDSIIICTTNA